MSEPRAPAWRVAMSLFTAIPAGVNKVLDDDVAARAVLWLPGIGLLLGAIGGGVVLAAGSLNGTGPGRLLGAALAVAVIAVLTGGLHLDGLADTADGLGSRRPADVALEIMRRSDIGPMGVGALVLVLLLQVAAVAAIPRAPLAAGAVVLAEVTGRVSVVVATSSPAARPGGFGALVAGRTTAAERALAVGLLAAAVAAAGLTAGGPALAVRGLGGAGGGLLVGWLVQRTARRRLGGMTGDVFGAIIELGTAAVLLVLAVAS